MTPEERTQFGSLGTPRLQCLYALLIGARHGLAWQTPGSIAAALQHLGIAISAVGVRNALDSAASGTPRQVSRSASRTRSYRIAQPGERALEAALGGNVMVVRIEAEKPLTGRARLGGILETLTGVLRITDPYYGARSADALAACTAATEVRLITGKCGGGEDEARVRRTFVDLTREHRSIQVRIAAPSQIPHDRYILTDEELILVGHGLKDIGTRESFVIRVPRTLLSDTAAAMEAKFDSVWKQSTTSP